MDHFLVFSSILRFVLGHGAVLGFGVEVRNLCLVSTLNYNPLAQADAPSPLLHNRGLKTSIP